MKNFLIIAITAIITAAIVFLILPKFEHNEPINHYPQEIETKLNTAIRVGDISFEPIAILEDSRCPNDVVCIQAGTVRIQARITQSGETKEIEMKLNTAIMVGNISITLTEVSPSPISTKPISENDYIFTFVIDVAANTP